MNRFEVKVFKTPTGSGVDAWTAQVHIEVWGGPCSTLELSARGETIPKAKSAAIRALIGMTEHMQKAAEELGGKP